MSWSKYNGIKKKSWNRGSQSEANVHWNLPFIRNTYDLEAWGRILKRKIDDIAKIRGKAIKQMVQLPISTPFAGIIMVTLVWLIKENIEYRIMMLYHSIIQNDDERIANKVLKEQGKL